MNLLKNNLISSHRLFHLFAFILICGFVFLPGTAKATSPELITTTGAGSWTAPTGVTSVIVDTWAGGGSGGGVATGDNASAGGGAGGGFASTTVTVVPGNLYNYYVGAGGATQDSGANGVAGEDSMFEASTTVLSKRGGGGFAGISGVDGAGGATTTGAVGTVIYHGGNGAAGVDASYSGAGGGGAGSTGNGGVASGSTAGSGGSPDGGAGGAGRTAYNHGLSGNTIGGGGSGGMLPTGFIIVRNGGAGARGQIRLTYTAIVAPTLTTSAPTSVATSTMTLNANLSATGGADATQHGFAWGTSSTLAGGSDAATTTGGAFSGTGDFTSTSARNLSGLTASTTYYFRAYATNSAGTGYGSIQSTTTLAVSAPTVTTQAVSSIAATTATGNGTITVTGNINPTVRGLIYGLTTAYGATTTSSGDFSTGAFTSSITSLTCNTLYYVKAYATNSVGTGYGSGVSFTTSACIPTLTTSAASSLAKTTATLNGDISDTGGENATARGFEYGATTSYGSTAAESGSYSTGSYSLSVSSLACHTAYHYRAYATNSAGSGYGSDTTFTTTSCPGSVIIFTAPASNPAPAPNNPPPADNPPAPANPPLINLGPSSQSPALPITDSDLYERLKGRIILRVESHGETYYISPEEKKMYYLGRPDDAFQMIRNQVVGITNTNLEKIPVSLNILSGLDSDNDGLPDTFEQAIGTDLNKSDTDGDEYSDKEEIMAGYSPLEKLNKLHYDQAFANRQKGRIFLQVERRGEVWYVNPVDQKRYYLGRPQDAFNLMRQLGLGISDKDYETLGGE